MKLNKDEKTLLASFAWLTMPLALWCLGVRRPSMAIGCILAGTIFLAIYLILGKIDGEKHS